MTTALTQNPYFRLMRFDRPIGTLLLLWPALWALWLAAGGLPSVKNLVIFLLGVVVMRAAGCVINDYADREWDGAVARTSNRPLATGEISAKSALWLFVLLMLLAFGLVLMTDLLTIELSVIGALLAATYPFMKRYHHLPQVVLGLCWAWSIPMIFSAETGTVPASVWPLFAAVVCWTLAFDTFYAMVDREDDIAVGIKSSAILFGRADLLLIGGFQVATIALLALSGFLFERGVLFYFGLVIAAVMFARQQWQSRSRQRDKCFAAFLNNNRVGAVIFIGLLSDYHLAPLLISN